VSVLDGDALVMEQHAQASVKAARASGDEQRIATALHHVVEAIRRQDRYAEALPLYHESLELATRLKSIRVMGYCLLGLAHIAGGQGDWARAARLLGASTATFERSGAAIDPDYVADRDKTLGAAETALGADPFADEFAAGRNQEPQAASTS
jgi:hypothetical protein